MSHNTSSLINLTQEEIDSLTFNIDEFYSLSLVNIASSVDDDVIEDVSAFIRERHNPLSLVNRQKKLLNEFQNLCKNVLSNTKYAVERHVEYLKHFHTDLSSYKDKLGLYKTDILASIVAYIREEREHLDLFDFSDIPQVISGVYIPWKNASTLSPEQNEDTQSTLSQSEDTQSTPSQSEDTQGMTSEEKKLCVKSSLPSCPPPPEGWRAYTLAVIKDVETFDLRKEVAMQTENLSSTTRSAIFELATKYIEDVRVDTVNLRSRLKSLRFLQVTRYLQEESPYDDTNTQNYLGAMVLAQASQLQLIRNAIKSFVLQHDVIEEAEKCANAPSMGGYFFIAHKANANIGLVV